MLPSRAAAVGGDGSDPNRRDPLETRSLPVVRDDEEEAACTESEALLILGQFERLYEGRIAEVEASAEDTEARRNELKLKIMTDWVKDLGEQNAMLIQTVHDLEQAAVCRVKLLQTKLQENSSLMSHNLSQPDKSEEGLNALSKRVHQLVSVQDNMQQRIDFLQTDIESLLELIKRGRIENNWTLDGLTFHEIQPSDIPAPADCTCGQEKGDAENVNNSRFIAQVEDNEIDLLLYQRNLENEVSDLRKEVYYRDNIIKNLSFELIHLRDSLKANYNLKDQNDYCLSANYDSPIGSVIDNQKSVFADKDLEIKNLHKQLQNTEENMDTFVHEYKCKMNEFQMISEEKCQMQKENENLRAWLACVEKEASESRDALTEEVAEKHDSILKLKKTITDLEDQIQDSKSAVQFKEDIIQQLRHDLKTANQKIPATTRRVRISTETCQNFEDKNVEEKLYDTTKQLEELRNLLALKDVEINKLKTISEKPNQAANRTVENLSHNISIENQSEILAYLTKLSASLANDNEIIAVLKNEYETVLMSLEQTKDKYEKDVALANEMLQDIENCLHDFKSEVLDQDKCRDNTKEFINTIENKIIYTQKLFQNKCEMCVKENLLLEINEIISKVTSGVKTLSEIHENRSKTPSGIGILVKKNSSICNKNTAREYEQQAIFAAILQQFRMMEEFRICTVEVQAATEDLREEVSAVISNLNSQHCKYVELTKMVSQVQDYLTRTRENISEVVNRLELQDEERARHNERITNNRIRLKDIKNEFNQTQSELSKCLNNVHNNIQQTNLLGYTEIHTCNDLLISVVEEVEQIVCNLHTFQSQGGCGLSTMTELKKQLIVMEHNVKELKKKCDQVLIENEAAQKSFVEKSKRLEKYECEVDNCHTKMQDVLESIIATRDKMNEFGCIKETDNPFQSTNETIKMKNDLRRLHKECEELKLKIAQESHKSKQDETVSEWENRVIDLQDQIEVLQSEIKCKQEANIFLKQSIESLEKELDSTRAKADDYRRISSTECLELKKKIFELENSLRVQKDAENNLKCLSNNETDSKKSQQLYDYFNKDRLYDGTLRHGLQGTQENVPQLFKVLQDTIQAIKSGLQELSDELKRLVSDSLSHACNSNDSVTSGIEILAKYVESIKYCSFEIEKIKAALYSKDKLMENMDEIIRIQKDSITISQSEVEDLHKTLEEKIDAQEKTISQCEKEKRQLNKQIELQVQTIGHLQDAVVEAKRTIDQLSNKAASDNFNKGQIIRSLNVYLAETQSQYNDCYGEASEQGSLLELQRDTISTLQKRISFLKCDEFLNAFMLHFVYYVILLKHQDELDLQTRRFADMKSKANELEYAKNCFEKQCSSLQCKNEEASKEFERLRSGLEDSCKKLLSEKQRETETLQIENNDLKIQLQTYKLDFDLIEEEMKKMGMIDPSVKTFKIELETMRSKNDRYRCDIERYKKNINDLKSTKECLTKKLNELKLGKDVLEKYKARITCLQHEIWLQNEEIMSKKNRVDCDEIIIKEQLKEIESSKEKIRILRKEIDSLKSVLQEKKDQIEKFQDYQRVKDDNQILNAKIGVLKEKLIDVDYFRCQLHQTERLLLDSRKDYETLLQRYTTLSEKAMKHNSINLEHMLTESETCSCIQSSGRKEKKLEEITRLTKELADAQEKLSSKTEAFAEIQTRFSTMTSKCESNEKRHKDEIMLLEKKLACLNQRFQTCTDKNVELVRQNKSLEDNYNKCMAELEDIVLQLEDMQSSLIELRAESDSKQQSLDCLSTELAKMRASRSEVCEESKCVLEWVRVWMREQRHTATGLQAKLREKQQQLLDISSEKKKFMVSMKRLKRANRILSKTLKHIRKPATKQVAVLCNSRTLAPQQIKSSVKQKGDCHHGFYASCTRQTESKAVYSLFRRECGGGSNRAVEKITTRGDYAWFPRLEQITRQIPRTSQISENKRTDRKTHEDTADCGYGTSSSK